MREPRSTVIPQHRRLVTRRREQEQEHSRQRRKQRHRELPSSERELARSTRPVDDNTGCQRTGYTEDGDDTVVAEGDVDAVFLVCDTFGEVEGEETVVQGVRETDEAKGMDRE